MNNLRNCRISECHYLDNNDDERTIMFYRINNMPQNVRNKLNTKYPNLINGIMPFIMRDETNPSGEALECINDWWDC